MKTVYLILKNQDMTEGRGPMVLTGEAFFDLEIAKDCINKKSGVMGRSGEKAQQRYSWERERGEWSANDHQIKPIDVF